jgi:hypothetical protein
LTRIEKAWCALLQLPHTNVFAIMQMLLWPNLWRGHSSSGARCKG